MKIASMLVATSPSRLQSGPVRNRQVFLSAAWSESRKETKCRLATGRLSNYGSGSVLKKPNGRPPDKVGKNKDWEHGGNDVSKSTLLVTGYLRSKLRHKPQSQA